MKLVRRLSNVVRCKSRTPRPAAKTLLVDVLANALQGRVLESGEFGSLAELAAAERISRSYVSRVLRLTLLVPDFVERIFGGQRRQGWRSS